MFRDKDALCPQSPTQVLQGRRNTLIRRANCRRLLACLIFAVSFSAFLFGKVLGVGFVSGSSMSPSFQEKDIGLYTRAGGYSRHDVVVLRADSTLIHKYVKRVIGMPGDTVNIDETGVSINGENLDEPYAVGRTRENGDLQYPVTLRKGEYFVLGDNRENSKDSRSFGVIRDEQIEGKVIAVLRTGNESERR